MNPTHHAPESVRPRPQAGLLFLLGLPALLAVTAAGILPQRHLGDLAAHFPLQCGIWLTAVGCCLLLARKPILGMILWVFAAVCLVRMQPQLLAPAAADAAALAEGQIRVAVANLRSGNRQTEALCEWADECDADLLVLVEVTPEHWQDLERLRSRFAHVHAEPQPGCFGIALLSRFPLSDARIVPLGHHWAPAILAVAATPTGPIGVVAAHPPPPSLRTSAERDHSLAALVDLLRDLPAPQVVLADLNTTPWAHSMRSLLQRTGLADSTRGQGLCGTWPMPLPIWLRIPLDHVLHSPELVVVQRNLGPDIGSDHLPVFARLRWLAPR